MESRTNGNHLHMTPLQLFRERSRLDEDTFVAILKVDMITRLGVSGVGFHVLGGNFLRGDTCFFVLEVRHDCWG